MVLIRHRMLPSRARKVSLKYRRVAARIPAGFRTNVRLMSKHACSLTSSMPSRRADVRHAGQLVLKRMSRVRLIKFARQRCVSSSVCLSLHSFTRSSARSPARPACSLSPPYSKASYVGVSSPKTNTKHHQLIFITLLSLRAAPRRAVPCRAPCARRMYNSACFGNGCWCRTTEQRIF